MIKIKKNIFGKKITFRKSKLELKDSYKPIKIKKNDIKKKI